MNERRSWDDGVRFGAGGGERVWRDVGDARRGGPAEALGRPAAVGVAAASLEGQAVGVALGAVERQLACLAAAIERRGDAEQLGRPNGSVESLVERMGRLSEC